MFTPFNKTVNCQKVYFTNNFDFQVLKTVKVTQKSVLNTMSAFPKTIINLL